MWALKHFRAYLYGHRCEVYTDHEALKSLLNTPQPSGKLARWGMAIQELDVTILHRSGKHNAALSRVPLPDTGSTDCVPFGVVAAIVEQEEGLKDLQRKDPHLVEIIDMLEAGQLPSDERRAKQLALTQSQYTLKDDVLYRVEMDGTLRVIPPEGSREDLFKQAHGGVFGAHLREAKGVQ